MISLCRGWQFTEHWSEDFLAGKEAGFYTMGDVLS